MFSSKKEAPSDIYNRRLAQYRTEADSQKLSSLERHVFLFIDKDKTFSPNTVNTELDKMHGDTQCGLKGYLIAGFNASHSSSNAICPALQGKFVADKETKFAKFLHLGTTRVWNPDGSVNNERLDALTKAVSEDCKESKEPIVPLHKLKDYLAKCYKEDKPEKDTGRNASAFFSSAGTQAYAADAAWGEVFDRLACGWIAIAGNSNTLEPYLTLSVMRNFFIDSPVEFLKAECGLLPVPKPSPAQVTTLTLART